MAKGLNQVDVSMRFTADTSEAERQLNELQTSLSNLTKNSQFQSGKLGMTQEISQAVVKTTELQAMLENCKTSAGALDLGKFTQSLKNNQTSIKDYAKNLQSLGPAGEQAFSQLARSITQAEVPLRRSSGSLQEFATTLKNTVRWQISSSILHGLIGAVQSAYGYAQDLNESLNNIRIVTGQNIDQMARFADQANKAAKALSATTTDYTNASLIYYQQGLSDSEVQERTDITIKMANVARQSAEIVSDQMTAVWNNFDDGSKSLEYYADVMTALGAATASSTDEIAQGLEKFSAVAGTVGLSYEYATAALATVTAETRQSADVVGTAFKTLFARIEGLQLGETLEDGTDLNKYSEALSKVGVQIKDLATGEMKSMDQILEDLGARWQTLAQDEKIALAQTVAGVRQYNQLISLMDNWDVMQENLGTAYDSSGALQEQADIYAESWEAARDRVTASLETIYQQLLNDEFFIDLTNGFGKFLDVLSKTIDGLGGLPGILTIISSLMFKIFGPDMIKQMEQWKYNFQLRSDDGVKEILKQRKAANEELRKMFANSADDQVGTAKADVYTKQANLQDTLIVKQQELLAKGTQLTEEEQRQANLLLDINAQMGQRAIKAAEDLASQEKINRSLEDQAKIQIKVASRNHSNNAYNTFERDLKIVKELQVEYGTLQTISGKITKNSNFDEIKQSLVEMSKAADKAGISFERIDEILAQVNNGTITDIETLSNAIETAMLDIGADGQIMFDIISSKAEQAGVNMQEFTPILNLMKLSFAQTGSLTAEQIQILKDYGINVDEVTNKLLNMKGTVSGVSQGIVALGQTLSNVAMLVTSVKGLFDTWNNEDMTFGEKLISTFTTLGMVIPMVTTMFAKNNAVQLASFTASMTAALGIKTKAIADLQGAAAAGTLTAANGSLAVSMWTVLWPIGLVIAAIAGLVVVAKLVSDAINADAIAAEKAAETAQELGQAYEDAKNKHQELMDSITNYKEAEKALDVLVEGTKEYQEALQKANQAAIELIQNNPGKFVKGVDYDWEDGKLEFSEGSLEKVQQASLDQTNRLYAAQQMGNAYKASTAAIVSINDANDEVESDRYVSEGWEALANIGSASSGGTNTVSYAAERAEISKAAEILRTTDTVGVYTDKSAMEKALEIEGLEYLTDAMWDNRASLEAATEAYNQGTEAYENAAGIIVNSIINGDSAMAGSENKDVVQEKMFKEYEEQYKTEMQTLEDDAWGKDGISKAAGVNNEAQEIFTEYAEAADLTGATLSDITGSDNNRVFKYEDGSGEIKEVSLEAMKTVVASKRAIDSITGTASKLTNVLDTLDQAIEETKNAEPGSVNKNQEFLLEGIKAGFTEDFSNFTQAELENLGQLTEEQLTNMLMTMFGEEYETKLQELGYSNAQEYITAFTNGVTEQQENLKENLAVFEGQSLSKYAQNADAGSVNNLANQIERSNELTPEGHASYGAALSSNINSMIETIDTNKQQEAFEVLANIDWSKAGATEEAVNNLGKLGIASDETTKKIMSLTSQMRELAGADLNDLNTALDTDVDEEEYADLANYIQDIADETEDFSDDLQYNEKAAKKNAEAILRFNSAIEDINENYEDWNYTLKQGSVQDQAKAVKQMRNAYADLLDIDMDSLSDDFIKNEENLELMKQAAEGSEEAYQKLQETAGKDILAQIGIDTSQYETDLAKLNALAQQTEDMGLADIEAGASLDDTDFLNTLTNMVNQAGMTAQEATDYLASMGIDAEVVSDTQTATDKNETVTVTPKLAWNEYGPWDLGFTEIGPVHIPKIDWTPTTNSNSSEKSITAMGLKVSSATKSSGGNIKHKHSTSGGGKSGSNGPKNSGGGGSSSKPSKTKQTKKSDIVERYKEITDAIDDVSDAMDKVSKKADRLYGSAKVKAMQEEIALSKKKVTLLEKQIKEAKTLLELDKKSLDIAAQDLGLRFTYDGLGNITNYTQQLNELYDQLAEVEHTMNSMSTKEAQDKYKESTYEPLQEKISALEAAMDQYEETRELIEDLRTKIDDEVQSQIDKEFEIFKYKIEVKLDVNDREMKILDLLLKRIDDDAFAAAQSMALLTSKTDEMLENFSIYEQGINDIYAKHGLTPEAAANMTAEQLEAVGFSEAEIETLQEYNDGLIVTTENLMDIKEQIEQSLIDLFDAWNDEINETIDKFNLLNDTLSAFQNIVDVLGYNRLGLSLDWQKDMIEAQNAVGLEQLESLVEKKEALEETAKTSQEHLEAAQKRLEKAQKTVKDENVLAELEADVKYWEEMVDKTQNELDQATVDVYTSLDEFVTQAVENYKRLTEAILEEWERSISAMGNTLEETMNMYDKAAELEERYVSNYEKAYSLSKLTSSIEKSLNDTTSLKHQQQLKDMLKEIQEIQESGKELSQYDLDYLQKKYDLTVAQMSLEDAYNAKTQVIRRRDSEGNWGYVYTANEEDKEAAMTTYRDKVYEMMELNENFIRDTESKLLEARQRMAEELAALADMALTEEEYNERATAIIGHYQELDSYYLGEIQKALDNNNTLYDSDALAFAEKAGFKLSTAIAFKNDYITITEEMAKTILSIEESTFKTREEYLQALAKATGLSVNTVTKLYEDGVIKALKLSEEQRDGIASIDEQNFKNKEDYLKEIAKITGLSIDEVTEMYKAGTLAAIAETEKLEGSVLGSNTVMTLSFGQTTLSVVTGYGTAAAAGAAFGAANTVLTAGLSANYASFAAVTETALGIAGMSSETFGAVSKRVMETSKEKANQYKESVRQLGEQMKTSFSEGTNAVTGFQKQYSAKIGECVTITKALSEAITKLMKKLNKLDPKLDSSFGGGDSTNINSVSDAINAWKNGTISSASLGALIGAEIWMDPNSNWGNGQERKDKMKKLLGDNWEDVWKAQVDYSNKYSYSGQTYSEWFDKWKQKLTPYSYNNMKSYDTGGYTGAWGPDGKLAMLHEKELVLNKQDTSNFLLALDVLERIISNVSANSLTFNPVQPINVGNLSGLQGLEQNITIHADFPDATSAKDIEEAFNLMINRASQYANIK